MYPYKADLKTVKGKKDETCRQIPYVCDTIIDTCAQMKKKISLLNISIRFQNSHVPGYTYVD